MTTDGGHSAGGGSDTATAGDTMASSATHADVCAIKRPVQRLVLTLPCRSTLGDMITTTTTTITIIRLLTQSLWNPVKRGYHEPTVLSSPMNTTMSDTTAIVVVEPATQAC